MDIARILLMGRRASKLKKDDIKELEAQTYCEY